MNTSRMKETLRSVLGDDITGWLHAVRFVMLINQQQNEIDMEFISNFVNKGDNVIDIGANGADWTFALSRQVGKSGYVFAFEADPYYANVTGKTIKMMNLKNVKFFSFGLSDRAEVVQFQVFDVNNSRVSGTGRVIRSSNVRERCVNVELKTLDGLNELEPSLANVRLIKCDVEGFELMVFRGGFNIIRNSRPIVITEIGNAHFHGYTDSEVFDFFKKLDYESYVAVSRNILRPSDRAGNIAEGPRPNRIMVPKEYNLSQRKILVKNIN